MNLNAWRADTWYGMNDMKYALIEVRLNVLNGIELNLNNNCHEIKCNDRTYLATSYLRTRLECQVKT